MAQRAITYGLDDDDWDSEALLTTLMGQIDTMMDNDLNRQLGRRQLSGVQYFDISDQQETEGRN